MVSLKQLVTFSSGHETTVGNYAPAAANFVDPVPRGGETRRPQPHDRHGMAAALTGAFAQRFAQRVVPAFPGGRPKLTVCHDFGSDAVGAVVRRSLAPQNRVLLRLRQLPPSLRGLHRFVLAGVDAVVVETDVLASAVMKLGVPAPRIVSLSGPSDLALFNQPPRARADKAVCRIVHVGDLEPEAGVAELLPCVVAWADRNPDRHVELWWSGEGCLRGVLEAQPLPANVSQRFHGKVSRKQLASIFQDCDLLAVPALSDSWTDVVSEAMASRLPVLGSSRSRTVAETVVDGVTGWVFDPFEAGAMGGAVDAALNPLPQEREHMRACAAARFRRPAPGLDERLRRAMRIDASELPFDLSALGLTS